MWSASECVTEAPLKVQRRSKKWRESAEIWRGQNLGELGCKARNAFSFPSEKPSGALVLLVAETQTT